MFHNHRRGRLLSMASAVLAVLWIAGCGGSSTGGSPGEGGEPALDRTGSLNVAVQWPAAPTRLIPSNTASLRVSVTGNAGGLSEPTAQILVNGITSARFAGLFPGSYTVLVEAFPNSDATGPLLAAGTDANVVIAPQGVTTVSIVLDSEVASVTVTLSQPATVDQASQTVRATLTAWTQVNGNGSIVPIDPSKVSWTSDTPTVATVPGVVGNGTNVTPVTGSVPNGTVPVTITGRYRELPVDLANTAQLLVRASGSNPVVLSTSPVDRDNGVAVGANITATFDRAMNAATLQTAFTLMQGAIPVPGEVSFAGTTATFNPTADLVQGATYTATITTAARDQLGNPLARDEVWTFTTHLGPESAILGAASEFNVLAGSAITNADTVSAPTRIQGLVGVFPGAAVTGLPTAQSAG